MNFRTFYPIIILAPGVEFNTVSMAQPAVPFAYRVESLL